MLQCICAVSTLAHPKTAFTIAKPPMPADSVLAARFCIMAQNTDNPDSISSHLEQAAELYAKNQLWSSLLGCAIDVNLRLLRAQKFNEVIPFLEKIKDGYPEAFSGASKQVSDYYFLLSQAYSSTGQYYEALSYCLQSTNMGEQIEGEGYPGLARQYASLSFLYSSLSQPGKALEYGKKNLSAVEGPGDPMLLSQAHHFIGNIYHQMREYERAVSYFTKSISIIKGMERPSLPSLVRTYVNLGTSYIYLEDFESSIYYLEEALSGARQMGNDYFAAAAYSNLGNAYLTFEEYEKALESNQLALEKLQGMFGTMHPSLNKPYFNIGKVYLAMKNYEQAEKSYGKALQIDTTFYGKVHAYPAETYQGLGNVYEAKQNYARALSLYQKSIDALVLSDTAINIENANPIAIKDVADNFILLETLTKKANTLAKLYTQTQDTTHLLHALDTYKLCAFLQDNTRKHMSNEDAKLLFAANYSDFFENAIKTAYQLYQFQQNEKYLLLILDFIEQNKANNLVESLARARVRKQFNPGDSLLEQENAYKAEIAYLESKLFEEKAKEEQTDQGQIEKWNTEIFSLNQSLEDVVVKIKAAYPQYYQAMYQKNDIDADALQNTLLAEDEMLLNFFAGDSAIYVLSVDKDDFHVEAISLENDLLTKIETFIHRLNNNESTGYFSQAYCLYQMLVEKALNNHASGNINHLIIVPDGVLSYLPFEVLINKPANGQQSYNQLDYLLKKYAISYQYSVELLSLQATKHVNNLNQQTFIGYAPQFSKTANPLLATRSSSDSLLVDELERLPQAEEEVRNIAEMLEGNFTIGNAATEEHFKQQAESARIVHVASHTIINDENPMYSKLVFAPGQDTLEDGLLHTYELYNMRLNADLVTLSACNTGIGKIYEGEGVMSLARGFMYAGVPNVLMSLWSVPDRSTSQIMQYFYEEVQAGHTKAEALRQAKLKYLQEADANTAAPFYWGAFVYLGTKEKSNFFNAYWMVGGIILIVIAVMALVYRQLRKKYNLS